MDEKNERLGATRTPGHAIDAEHDGWLGGDPIARDAMATVEAILEGGPASFPAELRVHRVTGDAEKVKVPHYGGYEHFERTPGERAAGCGGRAVVFRWTGRTRIAE